MAMLRLKSFDQTVRFSQPEATVSARVVRGQCPRASISAGA